MPGDNLQCKLVLNFPLPVSPGLRFALREGGRTIAAGVISKILPDDPSETSDKASSGSGAAKKPAATTTAASTPKKKWINNIKWKYFLKFY